MDLYSFFNSSTSWRVRIALNLKGVKPAFHGINIRTGENRAADYVATINPAASVPAIVDGDFALGQSLAIIDWLDAKYPQPKLIPHDADLRAKVLEFSLGIACDVHPINNLRVLKYLTQELKIGEEQKNAWYQHWCRESFVAAERLLEQSKYGGPWCFGNEITLADLCLIPQYANVKRFGHDVAQYARLTRVVEHAAAHPAFIAAEPKNQPDYIAP